MRVTKVRRDNRARFSFDVEYVPEFSRETFHVLFDDKLRWMGSVISIDPEKISDIQGQPRVTISGGVAVQAIHTGISKLYPNVKIVENL